MKRTLILFSAILLAAADTEADASAAAVKEETSIVADVDTQESGVVVHEPGSKGRGNGYLVYKPGPRSPAKGQYESQLTSGYDRNLKDIEGRYGYGEYGYADKTEGRYRGEYPRVEEYVGSKGQYVNPVLGRYGYETSGARGSYDRYPGYGPIPGEYAYGYDEKANREEYRNPTAEELLYGPRPIHRVSEEDYKYRTYGREGLGFDKRTSYALGLRFPLTPNLLETVYRTRKYEECCGQQ